MEDLVVVGAGIAGLACARRAAAAGLATLVIETSRGVGGRCATRRVEGQPVDHGLAFLHGSIPEFLEALRAVDATPLAGWPETVRGSGPPCQPAARSPVESRLALAEGVSAFPKHLARGLDVRLETQVVGLDIEGGRPALRLADGQSLSARRVALALPCEQAAALLAGPPAQDSEVAAVARLLRMIGTRPCLTLLAGYAVGGATPDWDIWYPEDSNVIQVLSHDSTKRQDPRYRVLVIQAHPRWSRDRAAEDAAVWAEELLAEAARLAGEWVRRPVWHQPHRWRYARVDRDGELAGPVSIPLEGGGRIALAGELFGPGGGAQAAYLSGCALASRFAADGDD